MQKKNPIYTRDVRVYLCVCVWIIHEDSGPQKHLDSVWFCLFFWSNLNKDNGPPSSLSSGTLKLTPLCLSVCVFVSFVCVVHHLSWSFEIYSPIPLHIILDILKHVSYDIDDHLCFYHFLPCMIHELMNFFWLFTVTQVGRRIQNIRLKKVIP